MKKLAGLVAVLCMVSMMALASPKSSSMTGWVSDDKCGAKGANAAAEACTKKCLDGGAKMVFVDDKDQKVLAIANPDSLKGHEGHHVTVSGSVDNGTLHVDSVKMAAAN